MGATIRDIFGQADTAEPAILGTYGEAPSGFRLPEQLSLGPVRLQVSDLDRSLGFYQDVLGLRPLERDTREATLAPLESDVPLVHLRARRGARTIPKRGALGLYHFAILLPDRPSLGRFVRHLGEINARAGAGDHLVSESLYLQDPDNLGIEVYADRPRSTWRRIGRELMMATDPVDFADLIEAAGEERWSGMPADTTMGHLHLHVGDLGQAAAFYSEGLGFDRMVWRYPGALFLAGGGYHHHLGTNTWAGAGATPPGADDAQLLEWTIELPDSAALSGAAESLRDAGFVAEQAGKDVVTRDPWGTGLRLRTKA
jgi:catechol 2,3-dioxygenase